MTKKRLAAIIAGAIAGALILIMGVTYLVVYKSYQGLALPGTHVSNLDVSSMTHDEIMEAVEKQESAKNISLQIEDETKTVSLADFGVSLDSQQLADQAIARPAWYSYYSSLFKDRVIPSKYSLDNAKAKEYLYSVMPPELLNGKPAVVSVNQESGEVSVSESVDGNVPDLEKLISDVEAVAQAPAAATVEVAFKVEPPEFDTAKAKELVEKINAKRALDVALDHDGKNYQPSAAETASFVSITTADNGAQDLEVNTEAIAKWVGGVVSEVNVKPKNGLRKVYESGAIAQIVRKPKDGRQVTNSDDLLKSVIAAYQDGQSFKGKIDTEVLEAQDVSKVVSPNAAKLAYAALPDEKWIDVNLTNHTATAYVGDQIARGPVAMVNGADKHPTVQGTFAVWAKVRSQTMRGRDYVTPGVPWILYFHGDYALHGAPWRSSFGYAGKAGSHGCINLPVATAKWFYDWAEIGTTVVSHE
ncbi:L,D-transpeptidase [Boudabousia marimammalium]|uniref:L,D-TPase catalytic domain-containing protein n=1 Tax=Boudabousia marimammalium TaxID=156892 RepID=A0A1Q5PLX7_9ACTO|nr:L,D-transpeptidase [Boudabousia marimammalium]OKL48058.1 hypothetical protein BM477_06210 [Boudabousia marimammalium]